MMRFQKDARDPPVGDYQDSHILITCVIVFCSLNLCRIQYHCRHNHYLVYGSRKASSSP